MKIGSVFPARRLAAIGAAVCTLTVALSSIAGSAGAASARPGRDSVPPPTPAFEHPSLSVVSSSSDHDAQLVFDAGANVPFTSLRLSAPDGRRVLIASFRDSKRLGQSKLLIETPEPTVAALETAYPSGRYHLVGTTTDGRRISSSVALSYDVLSAPVIATPSRDATGIPVAGSTFTWESVPGAVTVHLEVETIDERSALKVDLPGTATSFVVPAGFLHAGAKYTFDVKAVGSNGNLSVTDLTFTTG